MLRLKQRMVRVVLKVWSVIATALTPRKAAVRPVPVERIRFSGTRRRK